jgi:hypothetical protein
MSAAQGLPETAVVPRYILEHRHTPRECGVVFASFKAFESPLRRAVVPSSCSFGNHRIWWELDADTEAAALAQLPLYVAERTTATRICRLRIP